MRLERHWATGRTAARLSRSGAATARWFEEVDSAGIIPVSLIRWQLTVNREEGTVRTGGPAE